MKPLFWFALLPCALFSATLGLGCAGEASPDDDDGTESAAQQVSSPVAVINPSGSYTATVTANGTGCPAGTWTAAISQDGTDLTVRFSHYEAVIEPGQTQVVKDCTLAIDLRTPAGASFAVTQVTHGGYALLDQPGMKWAEIAKYYFFGNPVPSRENRSDNRGPYDGTYLYDDRVGVVDLVWSPCSTSARLVTQTRLVLRNNPARTGSGYVNPSGIDGDIQNTFRWRLTRRTC